MKTCSELLSLHVSAVAGVHSSPLASRAPAGSGTLSPDQAGPGAGAEGRGTGGQGEVHSLLLSGVFQFMSTFNLLEHHACFYMYM